MKRGSHPVCTVPGVLLAIASDICYLLKTSGFTIRSWKNIKNQSLRWRGVSGQRVQPGLPSRNTHRVEIDAFCLILERADVMFLSSPETTDSQKAFFFFSRVETEASPLLTCGISWDWRGSFPALCRGSLWYLPLWQRRERSVSTLITFYWRSSPPDVHRVFCLIISVDVWKVEYSSGLSVGTPRGLLPLKSTLASF